MIFLASLAVFAGFSLNLFLQFALGITDLVKDNYSKKEKSVLPSASTNLEDDIEIPFFQLGLLFISVLFLWVFFSLIVPSFWNLFSMYFLFFPFSALICMGLERLTKTLFKHFVIKKAEIKNVFSAQSAYNGLVPAALIITITLARHIGDVIILALFFSVGILTAIIILDGINKRSALESVPHYIRGTPLILISMGLLSLISSSAAVVLFRILKVL